MEGWVAEEKKKEKKEADRAGLEELLINGRCARSRRGRICFGGVIRKRRYLGGLLVTVKDVLIFQPGSLDKSEGTRSQLAMFYIPALTARPWPKRRAASVGEQEQQCPSCAASSGERGGPDAP